MDNKSADNSMISRKSWHVVLWLSGFLGQAEREAVLGDLLEGGDSGGGAVAGLLGLVVRKRMAVLLDLRLWIAVAFVVLPLSFLLSSIAETMAGEGAVYSWMYLNNWDWTLVRYPGFWFALRQTAMNFSITCLVLAGGAWSGGFLIGRLPNAVLRASRNTFIVLLATLFLVDAHGRLIDFWMFLHEQPLRPSLPDIHAPITANVFYHVFFPWIVLAILVILPALSGIRQGHRSLLLGQTVRVILLSAASLAALTLLIYVPGFGLLLGANVREWLWRNRNAMEVLPLLCCWPVLYFIVISVGRYWQRKTVMVRWTPGLKGDCLCVRL